MTDTAKLKAAAEKRASRLWERMEDAAKDNSQQMRDIAIDSLVALDKAELLVIELIAALEAARADCRENAARIAELESQRKLSFSACNRWADKCREAEKRIAELEARTVKLPPCVDDLHGVGMVMSADAVTEALSAAGINLETGGE
ncbi:hypothetical protein ROM27_01780 [Cronobacter malonaticus]|uniref:hypothetical protein n=1 Tax=Cronobacter malonaticus TaxID=413503 RepID=UPI002894A8BF|nr:hypothetical protein [Cronobacter malonaticus]MDT3563022.1 hypothetical protein [Cronobacter malonaticus]